MLNLRRLGPFEVHSFRLVKLANVLSGNCKSTETESEISKSSVMQITGYNLNDWAVNKTRNMEHSMDYVCNRCLFSIPSKMEHGTWNMEHGTWNMEHPEHCRTSRNIE